MLLKVILLVCVLVPTVRTQSKYCCFPDEWESTEGVLSGSVDDEGHTATTQGLLNVSFDTKGKRVHLTEMIVTGNNTKIYNVLQLYDQSVQYFIDNTTCTRSKLPPWNNKNCIPENSTVVSTYRLGQNESLMVTDYSFYNGPEKVVLTVTNDMCVPVVEVSYGLIQGVYVMTAIGFQGTTPGIKDPTVFTVPDICKGAPIVDSTRTRRSIPFTRM